MTTYAVGDLQGCYRTLQKLLKRIEFDPANDTLWLVGDLVNRGPRSLDVLRWARDLGDRIVAVLGNHDLHLLARAEGLVEKRKGDTLDDVLKAKDRDDLLGWLRGLPFVHRENGFLLVHAGLHPAWSVETIDRLARDAEARMRSEGSAFLAKIAGRLKDGEATEPGLSRDLVETLRAVATFTRIRTCHDDGTPCTGFSGPPREAPPGCRPWFQVPGRRTASETVVFGHWSALGLHVEARLLALDTGCVWGNDLSAVRLSDRMVFQQSFVD